MRTLPILAGLMLIAGVAAAQPGPDQGQMPGPQMGDPEGQGGEPPPPPPGQMQPGGPPPGQYGQAPGQYGQAPYGQAPYGGPPHPGKMMFREKFEAANVTHDGKLTLEQARAAHVGLVVHHFAEIDTERKGYVTLQDVRSWRMAMRQARSGQGGGPPPGQGEGQQAVTPPPAGMSGPPE